MCVCVCVCVCNEPKQIPAKDFLWIILLIYKLMKIIYKQTFEGLFVISSYFDHVRESEVY